MSRFSNSFLLAVTIAIALAPAGLAGVLRTVDFESPAVYPEPWHHDWERYFGYEATFDYGIRRSALDGYTTSTMYWGGPGWCGNCNYDPIQIHFSKPVKNIHFTLYNWYGFYDGPIRWDTRESFSGPPLSHMSISPFMNSQQAREITIPGDHIRYLDIDTNSGVGLDDFSFEVEDDAQASATYRVDLTLTTDPSQHDVNAKTITPGTDINAKLALGTIFSVGVSKRTPDPSGGPATITSVASIYTRSADKIAPALETNANLFPDSPVIQLAPDPTTAVTDLTFAAVHLGTLKFTLTPLDVGAPASVTLNLTIVRPSALGGEHNEWDKAIIDAAHERGVPPQILKGQIRQESPAFSKDELRYEPCSWDWSQISGGQGLISKLPYALYAMDGAVTDSDLVTTIDLRNRYLISDRPGGVFDNSLTRFLLHSDKGVTIREIWDANNGPLSLLGYDLGAEDQNWAVLDADLLSYDPDPVMDTSCAALNKYLQTHTYYEFLSSLKGILAQTPTASSYGVMQVMYGTAVDYPIRWYIPNPNHDIPGCPTGTTKCQTPRYLRDTAESLALPRGGSLFAGGQRDVQLYATWGPSAPYTFTSEVQFLDSFEEPLRYYTGGGISQYGINIVGNYEFKYIPSQPDPLFP